MLTIQTFSTANFARRHSFVCLLLALIASFCVPGRAQTNTSDLIGIVTDPAGAVVPNAHVRLLNQSTSASLDAQSDAEGWYRFRSLPVGTYTIQVEMQGFRTSVRNDLQLSADQPMRVDFPLTVGELNQSITVSSEPPLVDLSTSTQHASFGARALNDSPLTRQDWTGVLQLSNAVSLSGNNNQSVTLNGLPPAAINLTVDGTNASPDPEIPTVGFYQAFNLLIRSTRMRSRK